MNFSPFLASLGYLSPTYSSNISNKLGTSSKVMWSKGQSSRSSFFLLEVQAGLLKVC